MTFRRTSSKKPLTLALATLPTGTDPVAKLKTPPEFFFDVAQRSEEWFALRRGIPTASRFATVLANGKGGGESVTRTKLLYALAGEIISGETAEGFRNDAMQRGCEMEPLARAYYARTRLAELTEVGFIRRKLPSGRFVGASPDALVAGQSKALEIKTMRPDLILQMLDAGAAGFPPEHRAQCQGTMWVADLDEIDLLVFHAGMPVNPTFRLLRDEAYIRELSEQIEVFDWELNKIVERNRSRTK
jgi:putative phage-type endonuclease